MTTNVEELNALAREHSAFTERLYAETGKVLIGRQPLMEKMLIALLCRGHALLEGVPGLAKTLAVNTLAKCLHLGFGRIQFTPDLLPADLIGTQVYDAKSGQFHVKTGPVFTNILLADEINRAPAKVQSALLEAMQERQVTIGGQRFVLDEPFMVMATQNPIEQEGTYPLPEAQVDRFMFKLLLGYPSREEEMAIVKRMSVKTTLNVEQVVTHEELEKARAVIDAIYVDEKIHRYILDLVFATRKPETKMADIIEYGASPRASIYLAQAAKAHAFLRHRGFVTPDDIKAVGPDILRHRIIPTYEAEAEGLNTDGIIRRVFEAVPVP
ncbi:MAG: MoxR family ATPase [Nitrospinae bacterium]|nr:MoxR family ATPase [Nitrospinota bacterium]